MIIIGYKGIGKSSATDNLDNCIDLESSNFWVNGKRSDDWYIIYAHIAEHLSAQGNIVFTSSHQLLRDYLAKNTTEKVVEIYPSLKIEEDWINRLKYRYITNPNTKNKRALDGAQGYYQDNIESFMNDTGHFMYIELRTANYKLEDVIECIQDIEEVFDKEKVIPNNKNNRFYYTDSGNMFTIT